MTQNIVREHYHNCVGNDLLFSFIIRFVFAIISVGYDLLQDIYKCTFVAIWRSDQF